jgi:hypothetical protein
MKYSINLKIIFLFCILFSSFSFSQATLKVENNSGRSMMLKVMEVDGGDGTLYQEIYIAPYGSKTVEFSYSGRFFTKTKATLAGKEPVYEKGKTFEVVNDSRGYSVMTLTFSIKESSVPVTSGKKISKGEFEKN